MTELRNNGLVVTESKCHFGLREVKILGYVVCENGLKADPDKVAAIRDMVAPKNTQEVRRLLGSANYYRQFMPNYALIVAPIVNLTRKSVKFLWDKECQQAWVELKKHCLNLLF